MEEHVYSIRSYLPVAYQDTDTEEFIEYLFSAYLENLQNKKFQFSFTSFHMMYMSYIYKTQWFLKENGFKPIEDLITGYPKQERYKNFHFNSPFDLSAISETQSLSDLLKSLTFHTSVIENTKHHVTVRNNCSHAVGKVLYKRDKQVENYIIEELDNISAIHKKVKPFLKTVLERFIFDNYEKNWIENDIKDWIVNNSFSQKEIEELLQLKPSFIKENSDKKEIIYQKVLYSALISELVVFMDSKNDYFLNSLAILKKGLPTQFIIKRDAGDGERIKNTQELIEERIIPILTNLSKEEVTKAEKILQFGE